jgi:DNA-binding winged helix-turn-helix (wHTH) protein
MALYSFATYAFDEHTGLLGEGVSIPLSPLQHRLLLTFCRNPNTLLSKTDLIEAVWSHGFVSDVSLARTIHELRQRLGGGHGAKQMIVSVYGRGYIFYPHGPASDGQAAHGHSHSSDHKVLASTGI